MVQGSHLERALQYLCCSNRYQQSFHYEVYLSKYFMASIFIIL